MLSCPAMTKPALAGSTSSEHTKVEKLPGPWRRFVAAVKRARDRKGLSQAQVAEVIKVEPDVIKRLENGKAEPGIVLIADLVRYLEVDPMNVIYGQRSAKLQNLTAVAPPAPEARQAPEIEVPEGL